MKEHDLLSVSSKKNSRDIDVDKSKIVSKLATLTSKIISATLDPQKAAVYLFGAIGDFIDMFDAVTISKSIEGLAWQLLKNSLHRATDDVLRLSDVRFKCENKKNAIIDIKTIMKNNTVNFVDYNFIYNPQNSDFSKVYLEMLCSWLEMFLNQMTITKIKNSWSMIFTKAVTLEWKNNSKYTELLKNIDVPMRTSLSMLSEIEAYQNELVAYSKQEVFDEPITLENIYVDLFGMLNTRTTEKSQEKGKEIVNVRLFLHDWVYKREVGIFMVSGEPGSGKSTTMKMLASLLASEGFRIVYVDLFRVNFTSGSAVLNELEKHIRKISWMKDYDLIKDTPIILILDGLDEIRSNVWDNAENLVSSIKYDVLGERHQIIIAGRNKIIDYCLSRTGEIPSIIVLPLFVDEETKYFMQSINEREEHIIDPNKALEKDIRIVLWDKLIRNFCIEFDLENIISREHLRELSSSPLLLFLIAWTIKYSGGTIDNIRHSAQIFDRILHCIYTRKYNRPNQSHWHTVKFDEFKKMLAITGMCAWQHDSRSLTFDNLEKCCLNDGATSLYDDWITYHRNEKPSQLLLLFFFREKQNASHCGLPDIEFLHKSFYEYLSALEILNTLTFISSLHGSYIDNKATIHKRIFTLFSKNLIGTEILQFLEGVLEFQLHNGINIDVYVSYLNLLLKTAFNIEIEMQISTITAIYAPDMRFANANIAYSDIKVAFNNIKENVLRLMEIVATIQFKNETNTSSNALFIKDTRLNDVDFIWKKMVGIDFVEAELIEVTFSGAQLLRCKFDKVTFTKSLCNSSDFSQSSFSGCHFESSHMECSGLTETTITECVFDDAIMDGCYLTNSRCTNSKFRGTHFVGANLDDSTFVGCDFTNADFSRADLNNFSFSGKTIWSECSMEGAKLSNVKMTQFDFSDNEVIDMLTEADLEGANWNGVSEDIIKIFVK